MKAIELKAVMDIPNGELVKTGIYVFETTTIGEIRNLMKNGIKTDLGVLPVKSMEIMMGDYE